MATQMRILASWQLVAELSRRHPELWLAETHPGGGMYDCLWLCRPAGGAAASDPFVWSLNREGAIQHEPWWSQPDGGWGDLALSGPRSTARRLERAVGMSSPERAPLTTRRTLTVRLIAAVLSVMVVNADEREHWDCRSGTEDSNYGLNARRSLFEAFDAETVRAGHLRGDELLFEEMWRFWFLKRDERPVVAFDMAGAAWAPSGNRLDLWELYDRNKRDLAATATDLLEHVGLCPSDESPKANRE